MPPSSISPSVPPAVWSVRKIKSPAATYVFATFTLPLEPSTAVPHELLAPDLIFKLAIDVTAPPAVKSNVPYDSASVLLVDL